LRSWGFLLTEGSFRLLEGYSQCRPEGVLPKLNLSLGDAMERITQKVRIFGSFESGFEATTTALAH
jgi:hypothetical protein